MTHSQKLCVTVYTDSSKTEQLGDWSPLISSPVGENGENGFGTFRGVVAMSMPEALTYYDREDAPYIYVGTASECAFEGRIEDMGPVAQGLEFVAFGFWRALHDLLYTAAWVDDGYGDWFELTTDDNPAVSEGRWEQDNSNRLILKPRKGEVFSQTAAHGMWAYEIPSGSTRTIRRLEFSYVLEADSRWKAEVVTGSSWSGSLTSEWSLTGTGSTQTGTATVTISDPGSDRIAFRMVDTANASDTEYTDETGDVYFRATLVKVKTTASASLYADEIVEAIVSAVATENPSQLSADTSQIESPAVDLGTEIYKDARPADIVVYLAALGDGASPPNHWTAAVWEGQRLHFHVLGDGGRTHYVDIEDYQISRSLDDLFTSTYAVYNGSTQRTAVVENAAVKARLGFTRLTSANVTTSSQVTAEVVRDALLSDASAPVPRTDIQLAGVFDESGVEVPGWQLRSGDVLIIRNIPPELTGYTRRRQFTLSRIGYRYDTGELSMVANELPSVEFLLARREGLK